MKPDTELSNLRFMPYILAGNGEILEASYPLTDLTGYKREEFLGKTEQETFKTLLKSDVGWEGTTPDQESKDFYLFTKSNQVKQVLVSAHSGLGKNERIYIIVEKPNSRIEDSMPLLDKLCSDNNLGVAVCSVPELMFLKANERYLELVPEPCNKPEGLLGKTLNNLPPGWVDFPGDEKIKEVLETEKSCYGKEYKTVKADGTEIYFDYIVTPIKENGRTKYLIFLLTFVTERVLARRSIEEQVKQVMKQKEALENTILIKNEFLSFIAHEFKTPLTVINAAIQTMEAVYKNEMSEKIGGFVGKIRQNAFRQLRLVNNLLEVSRAEAGRTKLYLKNMNVVAVTKVITDSTVLYAKAKGVEVRFTSDVERKVMALDDEKFERILLNLLSNAIKFTPKGKCIYVKVSCKKNRVYITVKDEGVGIPKEKQKLIFERFGQVNSSLTRESEGTGIGLSLVKMLVTALEGEITVDSSEGKGSSFTVMLPVTRLAESPKRESLPEERDKRLIQAVAIEFSDIYLS